MCQDKSSCIHPEQLKGEPKDCSTEQIAVCHPGEKDHSCEAEETASKKPSAVGSSKADR